ncbi:hypothetical protein CKA32_006003 [Geitlerinema sp. FC II]|nr:hypothetical protein CKA32_006003 [Geitlerinema sp. FC II]
MRMFETTAPVNKAQTPSPATRTHRVVRRFSIDRLTPESFLSWKIVAIPRGRSPPFAR